MATDFTQDSVLYFIRKNGGRVKNSELLFHFKAFVREHENKTHYRELFKRFVNSVAVVKQDEGVSYVVLRKRFGGQARDVAECHPPKTPGRKPERPAREKDQSPRAPVTRDREATCRHPTESRLHAEPPRESHVPPCDSNQSTTILPSAGIVYNNNNNEEKLVSFEKPVQSSSPNAQEQSSTKPEGSVGSGQSFEEDPRTLPELCPQGVYHGAKLGQPKETDPQRKSFCPVSDSQHVGLQVLGVVEDSVEAPRFEQVDRPVVTEQRLSYGADDDDTRSSASPPSQTTLEHSGGGTSASPPCVSDSPAATLPHTPPDAEPAGSNGDVASLGPWHGAPVIHIQPPEAGAMAAAPQRPRYSLPLEADYHTPSTAGYTDPAHLHHHRLASAGLSSSHGSLLLSSQPDSPEWPLGSSPEEQWTSEEELLGHGGFKVHEMLRRAKEAKELSLMQRSERTAAPWHHSTGHLPDDQESSSSSSAPSWHHRSAGHLVDRDPEPAWRGSAGRLRDEQSESDDAGSDAGSLSSSSVAAPRLRPSARRINSRLRGRLCRSLGADLDQPFPEDGVAARHGRLQLLSSSLSVRYPASAGCTPSHSYRDLTASAASGGGLSSAHSHDGGGSAYFHKQDLEPTAHDWLVRGAAGAWTEIYSLFRAEPSLLNKRDFITGYTMLHWIAKHGDHRVLNTLWYGVGKMGQKLDVDARTTCGYTPLHLAAIHGHKKMIRLLVHKFKADVTLRDTSGRKAWQYLGHAGSRDVLELLGAPQRAAAGGGKGTATALPRSSSAEHLAPASARVKRSTSVAAFLKHKALLRFPGHHSDTVV